MALEMRETFVNATKGYQFGESGWYEPFTDDRRRLFASLQKEYGRASTMYRDPGPLGPRSPRRVGWVFTKRMKYDDARGNGPDDHYIREVWVEVRTRPTGILDDPRLRGSGRRRPATSRRAQVHRHVHNGKRR